MLSDGVLSIFILRVIFCLGWGVNPGFFSCTDFENERMKIASNFRNAPNQGSLTEGEASVRLTSLC
jgi:hypothetical protein